MNEAASKGRTKKQRLKPRAKGEQKTKIVVTKNTNTVRTSYPSCIPSAEVFKLQSFEELPPLEGLVFELEVEEPPPLEGWVFELAEEEPPTEGLIFG